VSAGAVDLLHDHGCGEQAHTSSSTTPIASGRNWHAELAHDDHVQRCVEHAGHLGRDRRPSVRQPEDHHVLTPQVARPLDQPPALRPPDP
jgi:hypothetical protein